MREYPYVIDAALRNGLPPEPTGLNAPFCSDMQGMVPRAYTAATPPTITSLYSGSGETVSWPFPQYLAQDRARYYGFSTSIKDSSKTAITLYKGSSPAETYTFTAGGTWQIAAFHQDVFLCNGTQLLFYIPSGGSKFLAADTLTVKSITRHNDRLLLAGMSGSWFSGDQWERIIDTWIKFAPEDLHVDRAFGTHWAMYCEPGGGAEDYPFHLMLAALGVFGLTEYTAVEEVIMSHIEAGKLGFCPCRTMGTVNRIASLGPMVNLYTDKEVVQLVPDGQGYRERTVSQFGVNAVGVSDNEHLALLEDNSLTRFLADHIEPLKYDTYFSSLTTPVLSFDPILGDWYIASGTTCYILTRQGLGGPHWISPTSLVREDGLKGVVVARTGEIDLSVGMFDMLDRGYKHITTVQIQSDSLPTGLRVYIDNKPTAGVPVNPAGVAFPSVSFISGTFRLTGVPNGNHSIGRIELQFQSEDKRYRRGPKGTVQSGTPGGIEGVDAE